MEALAQTLQDAFKEQAGENSLPVPVFLGSEWLDRQNELPLVIVVPGSATYGPPDGSVRGALAGVQTDQHLICKAMTYEDAVLLAEFCYEVLAVGRAATMRLRSEVWGDYTVRVADMQVTFPAALTRSDITRVKVKTFTEHVQFTNPSPQQEIPNEQNQATGSVEFLDGQLGL